MDNAALAAQQAQLKQQQQMVAQAQAAAMARQQQLAQPGAQPLPIQLPQQQQLQQLAMQQALQQQQQQMLMQQHQQQLAYQQAAQRQAQLAVQQRAAQLQAQLQYRPPQPGMPQIAPQQHAMRPQQQQPIVYPGAYGMMAAARPAAAASPIVAAPQKPAPAAPQKSGNELVLQLGRVKKIVKQASDVKAVANDANFAIARATELFIEALAEKSAKRTLADQRILLAYSDVAATVAEWKALDFLADIVPRKISASVLLRQLQEQQMQQQAQAATNGYAAPKPEAVVKSDGMAPLKPEADGHADVKGEPDGHTNGQLASGSMA